MANTLSQPNPTYKAGRFKPGNTAAKGRRDTAGKLATFRAALFTTVKRADMVDVVRAVLKKAKEGHCWAATLILRYCIGDPEKVLNINHTGDAGGNTLVLAESVKALITDASAIQAALELDERHLMAVDAPSSPAVERSEGETTAGTPV